MPASHCTGGYEEHSLPREQLRDEAGDRTRRHDADSNPLITLPTTRTALGFEAMCSIGNEHLHSDRTEADKECRGKEERAGDNAAPSSASAETAIMMSARRRFSIRSLSGAINSKPAPYPDLHRVTINPVAREERPSAALTARRAVGRCRDWSRSTAGRRKHRRVIQKPRARQARCR
jgi:hypothetical protein